ncbi:hypothetical protein [Spirosoma agri]|uniref:Uncharacterized protein n=1 Tax=Spirosoma agri TaxID=1987381 RepID=A0A6M0ICD0_9BACT|nr:hypothetical protein [Spirosoma agri]NEU65758.1 hypothetical protein [Spirosoma agri]
MIKFMIGALLITTTTLAQTAPQAAQTGAAKPASGLTTKSNAKATQAASASASKGTSTSATARRSTKPIPKPSQSDNLESKDNAIPSYKKEKDAGIHKTQPKYTPRRTSSGARPDTMNQRKQ